VGEVTAGEYLAELAARGEPTTPRPVTADERLALWIYTSADGWYKEINRQLREDEAEVNTQEFTKVLNQALSKLFVYGGYVYRGVAIPNLDVFLMDYRVGSVIRWDAFTSASKDQSLAFYGNVLFVIKSQRGRSLGAHSATAHLDEVLFCAPSHFRVVAVERKGDDAVIEVDEV
jgi:hypothetical protein